MTLATLLADAAARQPERPALAWQGTLVSYRELAQRARMAAGALRAQGAGAGDAVAFVAPNTPASIACYHGAMQAGAVAWPLNPLLGAEQIRRRVAGVSHMVDVDELAGPPDAHIAGRKPSDTAVVLHTSGTTGDAKRVELTHGGLRRSAEATARALGLGEEDVLFGAAPISHVLGMTGCMNAAIAAGACVALVTRFDAAEALETMEREGVTVFMGVPAMCSALLAASDESGRATALRLAHVGGAPLAPDTLRAFEKRFGAVVLEGYGMTEAGGAVAVQHAGAPRKPGSVGRPIDGVQVRLAKDGEVLVRGGAAVPHGDDGWLATGDVGRLDDDGDLFLIDRKKDVILRGGYTVYPRQVEEALAEHPAVSEAVALGVPHARLGRRWRPSSCCAARATPRSCRRSCATACRPTRIPG